MSEMQVVVFKLNNQMFGAETSQVKVIERFRETTKVPKMPDFIHGIINIRGSVIPVIDLNRKFDIGQTDITKKTKIIITEIAGKPVGYIVNDVVEIIKLSEDEREAAPTVIHINASSYIKSVGKKADKLISVIDLAAILSDTELSKMPAENQGE